MVYPVCGNDLPYMIPLGHPTPYEVGAHHESLLKNKCYEE
jgi:hypothetical protein